MAPFCNPETFCDGPRDILQWDFVMAIFYTDYIH